MLIEDVLDPQGALVHHNQVADCNVYYYTYYNCVFTRIISSKNFSGNILFVFMIGSSVSDPVPHQETFIWIRVPKKNRNKLAYKSTKIIKI